ncbi:MAG: hypothetical protein N5P05_001771 [Chroococcopsis gigantea SAG 12.99]|jgi:hypothetical protein|nr:hypothetical protein [Chroococcopsis gigantea SAG 12.99]
MLKLQNSQGERYAALGLGILFFLVGFAGFIPAFMHYPQHAADYTPINATPGLYPPGLGLLFGIFPTNFIHNLVHCIVGFAGIVCSADGRSARAYCRVFAYVYALIVILGLIPVAQTLFGIMPIYGNNVWFNAITGLVAAYFGFVKPTVEMGGVKTTSGSAPSNS